MVEIQGDLNMLTLLMFVLLQGLLIMKHWHDNKADLGRSKGRLQPGSLPSRLQTFFTAPISAWFLSFASL